MLLKIGFTNVIQNWFQKCYSKLVPPVLVEIDQQSLLKIGSTSFTQNWFHKHNSKLVPQTLLEISSTSIANKTVPKKMLVNLKKLLSSI